ncbi:unnamed protein product [Thlaspi arvense]|uniref:Glycosyltransferase family 28 N-terminal domain-containing protein n=1 Tax=Thlaspi arvense TaxID=13288 RepID=A0AAU9RZI0_THLAR|nr:unnamed protein product [Thlaspi arvense]
MERFQAGFVYRDGQDVDDRCYHWFQHHLLAWRYIHHQYLQFFIGHIDEVELSAVSISLSVILLFSFGFLIVILIVGTRGDVQPFVAIAKRLQDYGHRIRLATHANFKEFILTAGLEFYPLGGDPKVLAGYMVKNKGFLPSSPSEIPIQRNQIKDTIYSLLPHISLRMVIKLENRHFRTYSCGRSTEDTNSRIFHHAVDLTSEARKLLVESHKLSVGQYNTTPKLVISEVKYDRITQTVRNCKQRQRRNNNHIGLNKRNHEPETEQRAEKAQRSYLDLNLPVNETEVGVSHETEDAKAWFNDFIEQVDGKVTFKPHIQNHTNSQFRKCFGSETQLEIDNDVIVQILVASWSSGEEERTRVDQWMQIFLAASFAEARQKYGSNPTLAVKLVASRGLADGVELPEKVDGLVWSFVLV